MKDPSDWSDVKSFVQEFDLGPLPFLDLDEVVRRGGRQRQVRRVDRWIAVAAAAALVAGVGVGAAHLSGPSTTHQPAASLSPTPTPTPTPSPSTGGQRLLTARSATISATSVHVKELLGVGLSLDVIVTANGAQGTLLGQGKTSVVLSVGDQIYIKGPVSMPPFLPDSQIAAADGKWILVTSIGSLFDVHTLYRLGWSFTPYGIPDPTLGSTRDIDGIPTIGLVTQQNFRLYVGVNPPYRPYLVETTPYPTYATYTDWNAPTSPLPSSPSPNDVYVPVLGP